MPLCTCMASVRTESLDFINFISSGCVANMNHLRNTEQQTIYLFPFSSLSLAVPTHTLPATEDSSITALTFKMKITLNKFLFSSGTKLMTEVWCESLLVTLDTFQTSGPVINEGMIEYCCTQERTRAQRSAYHITCYWTTRNRAPTSSHDKEFPFLNRKNTWSLMLHLWTL